MELAQKAPTNDRSQALAEWLKSCSGLTLSSIEALPHDASFRRYFRIATQNGTFVAMDAPPARENCRPFVAIAKALRAINLNTPEIIAADLEQGFLLLTDFGDTTYLKAASEGNIEERYQIALDALLVLQACPAVEGHSIPAFTTDFMQQEWHWHKEWFLDKWLGLRLTLQQEKSLDQCMGTLIAAIALQPQVFMHRDYHSANLMVLPNKAVGILDFQDAFIGPFTYDLISILRDCYVSLPPEKVTAFALAYWRKWQQANQVQGVTDQTFLRWFDWMGVERHIKALFTFARKAVRDQQNAYLQHVPRTLHYLIEESGQYKELAPLHDFYQQTVLPLVETLLPCAP